MKHNYHDFKITKNRCNICAQVVHVQPTFNARDGWTATHLQNSYDK